MSELTISVSDPKSEGSLSDGHITYRVNSTSTSFLPKFANESTVVRRYNDFCWLSEVLSLTVSGCIIPSLPPKQASGRFGSDFVHARRKALEKFLQKIANHKELIKSEYFQHFLEANDNELKDIIRASQSLKPNVLNGLTDAIKSKWNSLGSLGSSTKNTISSTEYDNDSNAIAVDEILEYIINIENIISKLLDTTTILTDRSRKASHSFRDISSNFESYGVSEGDELGTMLYNVGNKFDDMANTTGIHASSQIEMLVEPLSEYLRTLASVKNAIVQRSNKRQIYVQELINLETLNMSYTKLLGQPGKDVQAQTKQKNIDILIIKINNIKTEFEQMTVRLLKDFQEFQLQKSLSMENIINSFVDLQMQYHQDSAISWDQVTSIINDGEEKGNGNGNGNDNMTNSTSNAEHVNAKVEDEEEEYTSI